MATIDELSVIIGADLSGLDRAFNSAGARIGAFGDSLSRAAGRAAASMGRIGAAGDELKNFGQSLSIGVSAPLVALGVASVKAAGDIQALEKGFAATYKGSLPLQDALGRVRELAKLPGLGLKEALRGATNLQAAGFSADLATRSLSAFGNALATVGRGKADLDGVGLALGQIASKGKISAEEINQLAERVPQIRQAMQAAFGTADTEVLQKMKISATDFVEGVTAELEKLPKVTGGINNAFENLSDSVSTSLASLGTSLNRSLNIEGNLEKLGGFVEGLGAKFAALPESTQETIFAFAGLALAVGPVLGVLGAIGSAIPALVTGLGTVGAAVGLAAGPFALLVVGVGVAAVGIIQHWDEIAAYFGPKGEGGRVFGDLATSISASVSAILAAVGQLSSIGGGTLGDLISVGNIAKTVFEEAAKGITAFADTITAAINTVTALFQLDFQRAFEEGGKYVESFTRQFRNLLFTTAETPQTISGFFDMAAALRAMDEAAGAAALSGGDIAASLEEVAKKPVVSEAQLKALEKLKTSLAEAGNLSNALGRDKGLTAIGSEYDYVALRAAALEAGIKSLIDAGFTPQSRVVQNAVAELYQLRSAYEDLSRIELKLPAGVSLPKIEVPTNAFKTGLEVPPLETADYDNSVAYFEGSALRVADTIRNLNLPPLPPLPAFESAEFLGSLNEAQQGALLSQNIFNEEMGELVDSIAGRFEAIGDVVGMAFGNFAIGAITAGQALGQALGGIIGVLAEFMKDFGKKLIKIGAASIALGNVGVGVAQIAAGVAVIAAAGIGAAVGGSLGRGAAGGGGGRGITPAPGSVSSPRNASTTPPPPGNLRPEGDNITVVQLKLNDRDIADSVELYTDRMGRVTGARQVGRFSRR